MDDQPVLRKKVTIVDSDKRGRTQLHRLASRDCHTSIARLLNQGFSANITDHKGRTALHYAAHAGHIDSVRVLIKGSASVNSTDSFGRTALIAASGKGHNEVVKLLIESEARLDLADKKGFTALHNSAYHGHQEVVETLLKANPPLEAADILNGTPLHASAYKGFSEITERIIKAGASVNSQDIHKQTALHKAVIRGSFKTVQVLVTSKASLDVHDVFGETPLQSAIRYGHQCIASYLQLMSGNHVVVDKSNGCKDKSGCCSHHIAGTQIRAKSASYAEGTIPSAPTFQTAPGQHAATKACRTIAKDISPTPGDTTQDVKINTSAVPFQDQVLHLLRTACSSPDLSKFIGADHDRERLNLVINCIFMGENCTLNTQELNVNKVDHMIAGKGSINVYNSCRDPEYPGSSSSGYTDSDLSHAEDFSLDGNCYSQIPSYRCDSFFRSELPMIHQNQSKIPKNQGDSSNHFQISESHQSFINLSQIPRKDRNSLRHLQISENYSQSTGDSQLPLRKSSDSSSYCQKFSKNYKNSTSQSQISRNYKNSTSRPEISGNPNDSTGHPQKTGHPDNSIIHPEITGGPHNSTDHHQISENPKTSTGYPQKTGHPDNSTKHPQIKGGPHNSTGHPQISRNTHNSTGHPQITGDPDKPSGHHPKTGEPDNSTNHPQLSLNLYNSSSHAQITENPHNSINHPKIYKISQDNTITSDMPLQNHTESNSYLQNPGNHQCHNSCSQISENNNSYAVTSFPQNNTVNRNNIHRYMNNGNYRADSWTGRGEMLVSYL